MEAELGFSQDQVHRSNPSLRSHPSAVGSWSTSPQGEEGRRSASPEPWISDRSVMAPLMAEYEQHIDKLSEQLHTYEAHMMEVKGKLEQVIKENERLHAELRLSVERQLDAMAPAPGSEGGALEEEPVIRSLQEQLQLSEQERLRSMELWQTAAQQLDALQQVYQKALSDGRGLNANKQQLTEQLLRFQQHANKLQAANQRLETTNQNFLKTLKEQNKEIEELHGEHRQAKADLRTATCKVDEMTEVLQDIQDQLERREEDLSEARGREEAAEKRIQQVQANLIQLEARLKAGSKEAEAACRERSLWEQRLGELQAQCAVLEEEKYEALAKSRESAQMAKEAVLQKDQALLREKQKAEELEETKEAIKLLIQEAAVRTRKEVDHVHKRCNFQIKCLAEELSARQLESADKESQMEKSLRVRRAVEEELEKMYKEGSAEPDFRKIDSLRQRCTDAERLKEDISLTLQNAQNKLKKMEVDHAEELSRCQEEVQRLQGLLAAAREDCVSVSDQRLHLQQEILTLLRQTDDTHKEAALVKKKAKQQVSQIEQEFSLKEQKLEERMRMVEESGRSSKADMKRLLTAQQRSTQHWKDQAQTLVQTCQTRITCLKAELHRQKQHSQKLEAELDLSRSTSDKISESQDQTRRLQTPLTDAEHHGLTPPSS